MLTKNDTRGKKKKEKKEKNAQKLHVRGDAFESLRTLC